MALLVVWLLVRLEVWLDVRFEVWFLQLLLRFSVAIVLVSFRFSVRGGVPLTQPSLAADGGFIHPTGGMQNAYRIF